MLAPLTVRLTARYALVTGTAAAIESCSVCNQQPASPYGFAVASRNHVTNLQDAGDQFQKSLQRERRFGSFKRSWSLPEDADVSAIRASVQHGILSLTISKTKPSEPEVTSIPIN